MNRILFFLCIFTLALSLLRAQTQTFCNSYSITTPNATKLKPISVICGNSIFVSMNEDSGPTITKLNLNGIPVAKRKFNQGFSVDFFFEKNGSLYIAGNVGSMTQVNPFLIKLDTTQCNVIYFNKYTIPSHTTSLVFGAKALNDGDVILCGVAYNFSPTSTTFTPRYGFFMGINSLTGSIKYCDSLSVGGSNNNFLYSMTEISSSSILFTGKLGGGSAFIGIAHKTQNTFSVTSTYFIFTSDIFDAFVTSNSKKVMLVSRLSLGKTVFKIDTALNFISNSPSVYSPQSNPDGWFFMNDKVYFSNSNLNQIHAVDTSLSIILSKNYPFITMLNSGLGMRSVNIDNNSIYTCFAGQQDSANFYLLKTDLTGNMNCATTLTLNTSTVSIGSSSYSFYSGSLPASYTNVSLSSSLDSLIYSVYCTNLVSAKSERESEFDFTIFPNPFAQKIFIKTNWNLQTQNFALILCNAYGVQFLNMAINSDINSIDLHYLPKGIYFVEVQKNGYPVYRTKLVKE